MNNLKKLPTIQDVARHARVSAATVSRVLSTPDRVSEATRERVHSAVIETGYTINQAARSLRLQRARTILAAMPGIGNPFYSTILDAVVTTATSRGYGLLVTGRLGDDPARWLSDYFLSNRADGLLLFDGFLDTRKLHTFVGEGGTLPLVAAYDELPDPQINSVITDNLQAAERAVAHLYELGHRKIGHVAGPSRNSFPNERLVGFRKALFERRLPLREDWVFPGDYTMAAGQAAAEHYLRLQDRPTAIFAGNDETAAGVYRTAYLRGVKIPDQLTVIGFDDSPLASRLCPSLTTMRQPIRDMGRMAAEKLVAKISGLSDAPAIAATTVEPHLVVRESSGPPGR